jgi:hypothetical protein
MTLVIYKTTIANWDLKILNPNFEKSYEKHEKI